MKEKDHSSQVARKQRRWTATHRSSVVSNQPVRPHTTSGRQQTTGVSVEPTWSAVDNSSVISNNSECNVVWSLTELPQQNESPINANVVECTRQVDIPEEKTDDDCVDLNGIQPWLGPELNSDDYDTDLEDNVTQVVTPTIDSSGEYEYRRRCRQNNMTPVTYLTEHLGDTRLRMKHRYIGSQGTKPLAAALKKNTVCEELDLSDNYMGRDGAAALARMLQDNMFVSNLNISDNFIGSSGITSFSAMLETNTTLKILSLKGNQLSDCDAKYLADALANNMSLQTLDLSYNNFGEYGGIHLAKGLSYNQGLVDLDLSWNNICLRGGSALARALAKNASLEILDLSWNGLSIYSSYDLSRALKLNKTLRVLDLSCNNLNSMAAIKLSPGIARCKQLESLFLELNPIGESGVLALLKSIEINKKLRVVSLENCMDIKRHETEKIESCIREIESSRDILIMYTAGNVRYPKVNQTMVAVFKRFIKDNEDRMCDLFRHMDKDQSGDITLEEFKYGLKDLGLRLTNKQIDLLLEMLDSDRSGTIEFRELMKAVRQMKTGHHK